MREIIEAVADMDPTLAARAVAEAARRVFPLIGQDERRDIITAMLGDPDRDRVAGMVHL